MFLEIRYALRMLGKTPLFTVLSVLILAIGIGASTAVFSALNCLLFRPLPYANAERVFLIGERNPRSGTREPTSVRTFRDWSRHSPSFEMLAAIESDAVFVFPETTEPVAGARVSANFFHTLGVRVALGRPLTDTDHARSIVVSDRFWRDRMGANPDLSKTTIRSYDVVGVLPPDFQFGFARADIWAPIDSGSNLTERNVRVIGLLRPATDPSRARAELEAALPATGDERHGVWLQSMRSFTTGDRGPLGAILLATVTIVLVIACLNIGAIQLARAVARQREAAIRLALGCTRAHVARLALWEGLLVGCAGGAAGFGFAHALGLFARAIAPEFDEFVLESRVLAFTFGMSVVSGLIFGTAPAMLARRLNVNETLKTGVSALSGARLRKIFVIVQTAMALTLLTGAGVLLSAFSRLTSTDPGFRSDRIVVAELSMPTLRNATAEVQRTEGERLLQQIGSMPAVQRVAIASSMPLFGVSPCTFEIEGRPSSNAMSAGYRSVSPGYFELYGIALHAGRAFTDNDRENSPPVAVVNHRLAALLWTDSSPIGAVIRIGDERLTVIGVAADVRSVGLNRPVIPEIYRPFRQNPVPEFAVAMQSAVDPLASAAMFRAAVQSSSPGAAVRYLNSMPALLDEQLALVKWLSLFSAAFATIALGLAAGGVYGVVSFLVARRTHEIGLRVALGAGRADIMGVVFGSFVKLAAVAIPIGIAGGVALAALLGSLLNGTPLPDPLVIATAVIVVLTAGAGAVWAPARRAAALDPVSALRCQG